jgi:hypothetical protein
MVETPLAFNFSKTRMVCDAFDDAWAFLQGIGSDLTEPSKSLVSRTMLAKRIIEMADQGLMDVTDLRDDALAFVQHNRGNHRTVGHIGSRVTTSNRSRAAGRSGQLLAPDDGSSDGDWSGYGHRSSL